jgi:hypothetical protein
MCLKRMAFGSQDFILCGREDGSVDVWDMRTSTCVHSQKIFKEAGETLIEQRTQKPNDNAMTTYSLIDITTLCHNSSFDRSVDKWENRGRKC